jgi:transcription elongation GreA/GreB family factor
MILTICLTLKGWQSISVDFVESIPRWAALGKRRENAASFSEKPVKSEPDKANPQISDCIEIASVLRESQYSRSKILGKERPLCVAALVAIRMIHGRPWGEERHTHIP